MLSELLIEHLPLTNRNVEHTNRTENNTRENDLRRLDSKLAERIVKKQGDCNHHAWQQISGLWRVTCITRDVILTYVMNRTIALYPNTCLSSLLHTRTEQYD